MFPESGTWYAHNVAYPARAKRPGRVCVCYPPCEDCHRLNLRTALRSLMAKHSNTVSDFSIRSLENSPLALNQYVLHPAGGRSSRFGGGKTCRASSPRPVNIMLSPGAMVIASAAIIIALLFILGFMPSAFESKTRRVTHANRKHLPRGPASPAVSSTLCGIKNAMHRSGHSRLLDASQLLQSRQSHTLFYLQLLLQGNSKEVPKRLILTLRF